jgi:NADH-quinone oxidoreductase subunit E
VATFPRGVVRDFASMQNRYLSTFLLSPSWLCAQDAQPVARAGCAFGATRKNAGNPAGERRHANRGHVGGGPFDQMGLCSMSVPVQAFDFPALAAKLRPQADEIIARYPESRSALLPLMHRFQDEQGYVSADAILQVASWLGLTPAVVESTVSFYSLFFRRPVGKYMMQPCRGLSCIISGAYDAMAYFREKLGLTHLETSSDGLFSYEEVECLAACDRAPCMQVNLEFVYDLTHDKIDALIEQIRAGTFEVPALAQTKAPAKTWHVNQGTGLKRAPGAQNVVNADDPGGVGDPSGERMLARLAEDPYPIQVRPTNERVLIDTIAIDASKHQSNGVAS